MPHATAPIDERPVRKVWIFGPGYSWSNMYVQVGILSSMVFVILTMLIPVFPDPLHYIHKWYGLLYLFVQLGAIVSRDNLSMKQVWKDHFFSFLTAIIAFAETILMWFSTRGLTSIGWEVLNFWHAIAWFDFFFGIVISNVILNSPYQREERPADH